jgi:GT2 family glycosyltransferase
MGVCGLMLGSSRCLDAMVGVVIVNFRSAGYVRRCLNTLKGVGVDGPIVIWDNSTDDADINRLGRALEGFDVTVGGVSRNLGFGPGVNAGVRLGAAICQCRYWWILNPDIEVDSRCLRTLLSSAEQHQVDILSPLVLWAKGPRAGRVWFGGGYIDLRRSFHVDPSADKTPAYKRGFVPCTFMCGAALMVKTEAWDALGGFRTDLFMYWEDVDLSLRAQALGLKMGVHWGAIAYHAEGGSSAIQGRPSIATHYYLQRNRILVFRDFMPPTRIVLGPGAFVTLRSLLRPFKWSLDTEAVAGTAASILGLFHGLAGCTRTPTSARFL